MEETKMYHELRFLVSSNQIEELHLQLFTLADKHLRSFSIRNYTDHTIRLDVDLTSFYCIATCPAYKVDEEFECVFSENVRENDRISLLKNYSLFKLKIQSEIIKEYASSHHQSPQKEQVYLCQTAAKNLKFLERKIIKKIEVDQLARPIQVRLKKGNHKSKSKGINFSSTVKESKVFSKYEERSEKQIEAARFVESVLLDSSQDEQEGKKFRVASFKRGLQIKHKTYLINNHKEPDVQSNGEVESTKAIEPALPEYALVFKKFNETAFKMNFRTKPQTRTRKIRNTFGSTLEHIGEETSCQLERQKDFFSVLENTTNHLRFTMASSPSSPTLLKLQPKRKAAPTSVASRYKMRSKQQLRKMKAV